MQLASNIREVLSESTMLELLSFAVMVLFVACSTVGENERSIRDRAKSARVRESVKVIGRSSFSLSHFCFAPSAKVAACFLLLPFLLFTLVVGGSVVSKLVCVVSFLFSFLSFLLLTHHDII